MMPRKPNLRLGLDVGGTQVKMALVGPTGKIFDLRTVNTEKNPGALARALGEAVRSWAPRGLRGTGVGVAGDVDGDRGVVRFAPNLGWKNVPLAELLKREKLPAPLIVENDANAAAWGAHRVELKGVCRNVVALTLGTGVGGGLVLEGRMYRGACGSAGELGHMVVESQGVPCACGNRGCLEAYAGGVSLVRWARREYRRRGDTPGPLTPKILADRARAGDRVARAAWRRYSFYLGIGLSNLINLFNPEALVLTGGLAQGAPLFLPGALREMKRRAFTAPVRAVRVHVAKDSATLGVVGAALLVP